MKGYSDEYFEVTQEIEKWPLWKVELYNRLFATSAHAVKVDVVRDENGEERNEEWKN